MKKIVLFLSLLFVFSCKHETVFTESKVNNRYSISIPEYLQPTSDLHKDASLQYQNTERDIYFIVIDEKKKTMENYDLDYDIDLYFTTIVKQPFLETIKNGKVSPPGRETINGNKALIADITGVISETEVYYRMAIVETPFTFYQILIWTRAQNKEKYFGDMNTIIESFKEMKLSNDELPQKKTMSDSVKIELKY